ncbi:MAG: hypothetical protein L0H64_17365 [Pseudonocardia sp.]|nr:hypothetical protein [Pseudonocardia sp.]
MSIAARGASAQDDPAPWPRPPVGRTAADPVASRRTVLVANFGDDVGAATHLAALGGRGDGRVVVVRPTPGAGDLRTLGLDVLVAAGKRPDAAKTEGVSAACWDIARAWLRGREVGDVVVDRAHRLTEPQAAALAAFAAEVGASLWLIWGGREDPAHLHGALAADGRLVEQVGLWELRAQLPAPAPIIPTGPGDGRAWPVLPAANFTTFLAVCRRHLSSAEFGLVAEVYYDTAEATDAWLGTRERPGVDNQSRFAAALTGWLRDVAIGPAPAPAAALVRLRAAQAALFTAAIVLGWEPAALGPEPARRLLGDLTVGRAEALRAGCRTDAAAATALSLHLNLGPTHFELLRIGDVAPDGSAIRPPTSTALHRPGYGSGSNATPQHAVRMLAAALNKPRRTGEDERVGWGEFCCREPITLPAHAWSILAAHRAYRVGRSATDEDPLFVHPREPGSRSPAPVLREAIRRSCHRLRIDPPWTHGGGCRYGGDVGLVARRHGWMVERGLSMLMLDPQYPAHIPQPPRPRPVVRHRPRRAEWSTR